MKVLFLDDDENRHSYFKSKAKQLYPDDTTICYTYDAATAMACLRTERFDTLHLDHDLGGEVYVTKTENTGYEVALFISEELPKSSYPNKIIIHTWNPAGAQRMFQALESTGIKTYIIPFGT